MLFLMLREPFHIGAMRWIAIRKRWGFHLRSATRMVCSLRTPSDRSKCQSRIGPGPLSLLRKHRLRHPPVRSSIAAGSGKPRI